jgi:hypothetical protein
MLASSNTALRSLYHEGFIPATDNETVSTNFLESANNQRMAITRPARIRLSDLHPLKTSIIGPEN